MLVHAFIFCSYLSPLFGGLLSDVYIGKYWTVFLLSIVYCVGQSTIAITAIPGKTQTEILNQKVSLEIHHIGGAL
jgi:dipeptide/tripeptide permease